MNRTDGGRELPRHVTPARRPAMPHFAMLTACVLLLMPSPSAASATRTWLPIFEESFLDASYASRWVLEGEAHLALRREESTDFLEIRTLPGRHDPRRGSTNLWYREPFRGRNLKYVFRMKGTHENRSQVLLHANPGQDTGLPTIFDWARPDALWGRIAKDARIELYSLGILRADQATCYLRHLGKSTAHLPLTDIFHDETNMHGYASPFFGRPNVWFVFELSVLDDMITLKVDGQEMFRVKDTGNAGSSKFPWEPLTNGGWFAFRNFTPSTVGIDYLKVYRLENKTQ